MAAKNVLKDKLKQECGIVVFAPRTDLTVYVKVFNYSANCGFCKKKKSIKTAKKR